MHYRRIIRAAMTRIESLLYIAVVLLSLIVLQLWGISRRLRKQFPTPKEQDQDWAVEDPTGHWEAHKKDK
jgi:hypothetical protein